MPEKCNGQSFENSWSRWFFAVFIIYILYLAYRLVEPYLVPIFLAVVVVVVGGPIYDWFNKLFKGRGALASSVTCLLLVVILAIPFFLIAGVITSQALGLYNTVSGMLADNQLQETFSQGLGKLSPYLNWLEEKLGITQAEVLDHVGNLIKEISNFLYRNVGDLLRGATNMIIGFALVMFVAFYLFMDGTDLARGLIDLSPLPKDTNSKIQQDILNSLRATMKGIVVLAFLNGGLNGLGFSVFSVPNAIFWGTVMVFASVVPLVGTALVYVPACIYLIVTGHLGAGIGVFIWCLAVGVLCDNFLRPKLLAGQTNLHPLATFFSVIGGLSLFGVVGLILGPLVLAILISLLNIYKIVFLQPKEPLPAISNPASQTSPGQDDGDADKGRA